MTSSSDARATIVGALRGAPDGVSFDDAAWLQHLHSSYIDRYKADNDRIWSTASLLVPLSLAAFPVFVSLKDSTWRQAVVFGVASFAVMGLWYVLASAHKAFQTRSYDIARAIEVHVLGEAREKAIRDAVLLHAPDARIRPSRARLFLLLGTAVGWVGVTVAVGVGWL